MWDPQAYLDYDELRSRPFHELVARVGAERPRRVVDAGCGPGTLTAELERRWPGAVVEAFDSSPEMVAAARERGVDARLFDITEWRPEPDTDVVVSNAVLQWVPGHAALLRRSGAGGENPYLIHQELGDVMTRAVKVDALNPWSTVEIRYCSTALTRAASGTEPVSM